MSEVIDRGIILDIANKDIQTSVVDGQAVGGLRPVDACELVLAGIGLIPQLDAVGLIWKRSDGIELIGVDSSIVDTASSVPADSRAVPPVDILFAAILWGLPNWLMMRTSGLSIRNCLAAASFSITDGDAAMAVVAKKPEPMANANANLLVVFMRLSFDLSLASHLTWWPGCSSIKWLPDNGSSAQPERVDSTTARIASPT